MFVCFNDCIKHFVRDAVKDEILKWLNVDIFYPIFDSPWVSLVHVVPKKGEITVTRND